VKPTRQRLALFALALLGLTAPPAYAQVEGKIVRVGLFATPQLARSGCWSFVEVDLRWRGDKPLDGELHVDQFDRDGDVVTSVMKTALTPDGEWHRRQLYFVPHDISRNNIIRVKLFDDRGHLVKMLDERLKEVSELASQMIYEFPADSCLIVQLTREASLAHLSLLDSERIGKSGEAENARKVRRMSPEDLPQRAQGLEAVDAIVWDNADPKGLSEQQIEALARWVDGGGRLLITGGTNWQSLSESRLAGLLPVTISGITQVSEAQEFTEIVHNTDYGVELDKLYSRRPITRCEMTPRADALPIPATCPNEQIAYRRLVGRGSVVFVGASFNDLLPVPRRWANLDKEEGPAPRPAQGEEDPFPPACENVIARTFLALASVQEEPAQQAAISMGRSSRDLFQMVRRSVTFESLSGAFLVFAILFALAYTLAATLGSYWYLNRRSLRHWCWVAFAMVGIVGSVIGTAMVWSLRGVTKQVWQTTIVDGQSGVPIGQATCLFGVKTPDHTRLSLRLPQGAANDDPTEGQYGLLHAMPEAHTLDSARFVAAENYQSFLAGADLADVPVRATLKEFIGQWRGPLGGTLDAKLIAEATTGEDKEKRFSQEFGGQSYIRNNLGMDLRNCFLLETRDEWLRSPSPANRVGCLYVGDLPKSGPGSALNGEQIRQRLYYVAKAGVEPGDPSTRLSKYPSLSEQIKQWRGQSGGGLLGMGEDEPRAVRVDRDEYYASLLLLSVFNLLEPESQDQKLFRRSHGRSFDCTAWLTTRTAILIGWSDEAPPARLEINGAVYRPNRSRTMYRFVIPVERPK
jgi:hypothetical protein